MVGRESNDGAGRVAGFGDSVRGQGLYTNHLIGPLCSVLVGDSSVRVPLGWHTYYDSAGRKSWKTGGSRGREKASKAKHGTATHRGGGGGRAGRKDRAPTGSSRDCQVPRRWATPWKGTRPRARSRHQTRPRQAFALPPALWQLCASSRWACPRWSRRRARPKATVVGYLRVQSKAHGCAWP